MNIDFTYIASLAVERMGWALLHSIWEIALVAGLFGLAMWHMRDRTANARYAVACGTLFLMILLPVLTVCLIPGATFDGPDVPTIPEEFAALQPLPDEGTANNGISSMTEKTPGGSGEKVSLEKDEDRTAAAALRKKTEDGSGIPVLTATQGFFNTPWMGRALYALENCFPWLILVWWVGVFLLSLRHMAGWVGVQQIRQRDTSPVTGSVRDTFSRLAGQLGVARPVELLKSASARTPVAIGWIRPVVLIPASLLTSLSPRQLETILTHELAHIRRHDYLVNLIQAFVETVLFYHPAVWWISHRIREEREMCCDDMAVGICGDRSLYARALAAVAEFGTATLQPAVAATGGTLLMRIKRVLGLPTEGFPLRNVWIAGLILVVALAGAVFTNSEVLAGALESDVPQVFEGRIVDAAGKGFPGVQVQLNAFYKNVFTESTVLTSDGQGVFSWSGVPGDSVSVNVKQDGFRNLEGGVVIIGDEIIEYQVRPSLTVKGRVTDSSTGEPVDRFLLIPGYASHEAGSVSWSRRDARHGDDGEFTWQHQWRFPVDALRIEAAGYIPAVSPRWVEGEGEITFDFALEKGRTLVGRLRDCDGRVVDGAEVFVITQRRHLSFQNGKSRIPDTLSMLTNSGGRFWLQPQDEPYSIVVIDDAGYAEATEKELGDSPEVVLQPWASVQGRILRGSEPAGGEKVRLQGGWEVGMAPVWFSLEKESLADGSFRFDRVPPVSLHTVGRVVTFRKDYTSMEFVDHGVTVHAEPGRTATVTVGGEGRSALGYLVGEDGKPMELKEYFVNGTLCPVIPRFEPPKELLETLMKLPVEERAEKAEKWMRSPEAREYRERKQAGSICYAFGPHEDGTFRIEDIPAGKYRMNINIHERKKELGWGLAPLVARVQCEVEIPEALDGEVGLPVDLGAITVTAEKEPRSGMTR
jgi:beta-lactamase regulating signal transducer with metallopeptidase domain